MPTTIQVQERTLKRLKEHKYSARQSYDELLNRLLDEVEDESITEEEILELQEALEQVRRGQLYNIEDVAEELGIKL